MDVLQKYIEMLEAHIEDCEFDGSAIPDYLLEHLALAKVVQTALAAPSKAPRSGKEKK